MTITLINTGCTSVKGKFLVWSSERSMRPWFFHAFRGVTTNRWHWAGHFLGFVTAGSLPTWRNSIPTVNKLSIL